MNCHIARGRSLGNGDHNIAIFTGFCCHQQPITTGGTPDRRGRSGRTLLPHTSGAPRVQGIPGKSSNTVVAWSTHKVGSRRACCHSTTVAIPSTSTNCLGYCGSLRRRVAWASSVPIRLPNATLICLYSTEDFFLRSVLNSRWVGFISSKKADWHSISRIVFSNR